MPVVLPKFAAWSVVPVDAGVVESQATELFAMDDGSKAVPVFTGLAQSGKSVDAAMQRSRTIARQFRRDIVLDVTAKMPVTDETTVAAALGDGELDARRQRHVHQIRGRTHRVVA